MSELKPCPFCGGDSQTMRNFDSNDKMVHVGTCNKCFARTGFYEYKEEAIKAWNTRKEATP